MEKIKQMIPQFLKHCLDLILDYNPDLIGFSSSYYQNCSSLLLSKIIKEKINIPIIFGGSNCEGIMGFTLLKYFPQIDFICSGDGELAITNLIKQLYSKNKKIEKINGILTRESTEIDINLTNPVLDMDVKFI